MILGRGWTFISTPKCATNSLFAVLKTVYRGKQASGAFHRRVIPLDHVAGDIFTCVRNPYSRAVSAWASGVMSSLTFPEFLAWLVVGPHVRPMFKTMSAHHGDLVFKSAWKLESLEDDMRDDGFDLHDDELPVLNTSEHLNYLVKWAGVPDYLRLRFNEWAAEDFERYGYLTL